MCDGMHVPSFLKTENKDDAEILAPVLLNQYNSYKEFVKFPGELNSIMNHK